MPERCVACGRPIVAVRASNRVLTLDLVWTHVSKRANRNHTAIPQEAMRDD